MLRRLESKDAPYMLEWMHDDAINCHFRYPFQRMTLAKVEEFIAGSFDEENQHFAIVDDADEYMGTISLKAISQKDKSAEYAIVTRKKAQGTGCAMQSTKELLQYAFEELGLYRIYLNVLENNQRARRFYEKCGFMREENEEKVVMIGEACYNLAWYGIYNAE